MKRLLGCLLACSLLTTPSLAFAQEAGGIATVATIGEPPTLDPMAVSYTHLDVYKRQSSTCSRISPPRRTSCSA